MEQHLKGQAEGKRFKHSFSNEFSSAYMPGVIRH